RNRGSSDPRLAVPLDGSRRRQADGRRRGLVGLAPSRNRRARLARDGRGDLAGRGGAPRSAPPGADLRRADGCFAQQIGEAGLRDHRSSDSLRAGGVRRLNNRLMAQAMSADKDANMARSFRIRFSGSRAERGAALIEFTLILPMLLIMTVAAVDFGRAFFVK